MSEYMEKHTVSRLVGSPGYVGYDEAVSSPSRAAQRSRCALRRDREGHPASFNTLLQI